MRPKSLHRPGLAAILCGFLAVACAPTVQVHGYVPPQADIARIRPGVDNTAAVQQILGLPSSSGVLRDSACSCSTRLRAARRSHGQSNKQ